MKFIDTTTDELELEYLKPIRDIIDNNPIGVEEIVIITNKFVDIISQRALFGERLQEFVDTLDIESLFKDHYFKKFNKIKV